MHYINESCNCKFTIFAASEMVTIVIIIITISLPKFIKDRSVDDIEVTDVTTEYKASVDNYAGSEYEKYIKDLKIDGEIAGYF